MTCDLVLRAPHVITPAGEVAASIGIVAGRIAAIEPFDVELDGIRTVELTGDEALLPGVVDTHVHVNEPGRTEWEGFASATRAAAAGGITTIIDMPLNCLPPTCDVRALEAKRETAYGQAYVDVGCWGGAIPGNLAQLPALHRAGVFGFKCFLAPSGVDEFPPLSTDELTAYLVETRAFDPLFIVHCEDAAALSGAPEPDGRQYAAFLRSRPSNAESVAIATVLDAARRIGARVHVLHLSSASALPMLAAARDEGVRVTVETCPHYLTLTAEQVPDGGTSYKCCPPIREAANRDLLWQGLADEVIDCIVSDHSPSPPELKRLDTGDFGTAWGGIASVQLSLAATWTEARRRGVPLSNVARWMAAEPARLAGLRYKGRIEVGRDADLVAFVPDEEFVVDPAQLHHRHPITPYAGHRLAGVVRHTWLRGREVTCGDEPRGALLRRGDHEA